VYIEKSHNKKEKGSTREREEGIGTGRDHREVNNKYKIQERL
jgi:hypothetical protein